MALPQRFFSPLEIGFYCVALTGLELTFWTRLALNVCLSAGIKDCASTPGLLMEFYVVFSISYNTKVAACCCCIGISYSRGRGTTLVPRCLYEFAYRAVMIVLCFIVPFAMT